MSKRDFVCDEGYVGMHNTTLPEERTFSESQVTAIFDELGDKGHTMMMQGLVGEKMEHVIFYSDILALRKHILGE